MIDFDAFPCPCYILDEERLRQNLAVISDVAKAASVEMILAFKAFALWRTFPMFREYIQHAAASSPYEARLALEEFGGRAYTYSPAYTLEDFSEILRCSDHITFNSLSQFNRFYPLIDGVDHPVSCGLRINPAYSEVATAKYNPCMSGTRFGIAAGDLPLELPDVIEGFHCHCLCESSSYELERVLERLVSGFGHWLGKLKWLNLGGGHLMTGNGYNIPHLKGLLMAIREKYPNLSIILEPGSAFLWQTGVLVARVVDVVENDSIKTAVLNVSFTCHMPDCLEMPYQPGVQGAKQGTQGKYVYRLGGNSCLSGDFMGSWVFDHPLRVGERIVFEDMIHYTTVKTTMFNGIAHPAIGLWTMRGKALMLREFSYEDYRDRMC